ncbi:MAG: hypothetical protein R8P61_14975 [Bacteroidia bacterium]|nr:hypothetical protein [Bacteroidia bacterium]
MLTFLALSISLGMPQVKPASVEAYVDDSYLVNADAMRRDNSKAYMQVYKHALDELREEKPEKYKEVKKKYQAAKHLYRKYKYLAVETEKKIEMIKQHSQDLLSWLNEMQEVSEGKVYAYIGSKVRFSSYESLGDTHIRYVDHKGDAMLAVQLEAERGLLLLPPQPNAVKITLATDASLPDCKHELGHYAYIIIEPANYYEFLLGSSEKQDGDGHLHQDPSGVMAELFELQF